MLIRASSVRRAITALPLLAMLLGCREKLVADTPDYTEYGWELWAEADYRGAIAQVDQGITLDEGYADTWNGLEGFG